MYQRTTSQLGFSLPTWLVTGAQKFAGFVTGKPTTAAGVTVTLPAPPAPIGSPQLPYVAPGAAGIDNNTLLLLGGAAVVAFMLLGKRR